MKTKRLLFISCLAAGALIASPSFGKPAKKSAGTSRSNTKRVAPQMTQVMRNDWCPPSHEHLANGEQRRRGKTAPGVEAACEGPSPAVRGGQPAGSVRAVGVGKC